MSCFIHFTLPCQLLFDSCLLSNSLVSPDEIFKVLVIWASVQSTCRWCSLSWTWSWGKPERERHALGVTELATVFQSFNGALTWCHLVWTHKWKCWVYRLLSLFLLEFTISVPQSFSSLMCWQLSRSVFVLFWWFLTSQHDCRSPHQQRIPPITEVS